MLVLAGSFFNSINEAEETSDMEASPPSSKELSTPASSLELEIVLYVASLVSNPTEIDLILDKVRLITARLQPGQTLSPKDQQTLVQVYTQLEDYLLHKDTLRVFTLDNLRKGIRERFNLNNQTRTLLWRDHTPQQ